MYRNDSLAPISSASAAFAAAAEDTIGGRISFARDATGLSVAHLSAVVGVTERTWKNWEADRAEPRANRLDMLARVLGVNITWLISGVGPEPRFH